MRRGMSQLMWIVVVATLAVIGLVILAGVMSFFGGNMKDFANFLTFENFMPGN